MLFQVEVNNDDGGTRGVSDMWVKFGHVTTRHNQFRKLPAGPYELDVIEPAGYELTGITCTDRWDRAVEIDDNVLVGTPKLWLTCTYSFDDL